MFKMNSPFSLVAIVTFYCILVATQSGAQQYEAQQGGAHPPVGVSRNGGLMNVHVPLFYEMIKNGNSMGINVLRGLVQVERGDEATRSGLYGPRPLSVRVFGVPVYERGTRMRDPNQHLEHSQQYQNFQPNEIPYDTNAAEEVPNIP